MRCRFGSHSVNPIQTENVTTATENSPNRKWRETKQQLILWSDLAVLGCCLVSLHFQGDILSGWPCIYWEEKRERERERENRPN